MKAVSIIALLVAYLSMVDADLYMDCPRGSNNRLNEKSANRKNANRVFDSQNNNRGGYNVGDATDKEAGNNPAHQYQMRYIMSPLDPNLGESVIPIEFTNQHGCGSNTDSEPNKLNCNIVFQYMCQPATEQGRDTKDEMRDGTNTNTNDYKARAEGTEENYADFKTRKDGQVKTDRALQEPFEWYDKCNERTRSKGLFTADQQLKGHASKYTRQNPQGTRRGYECPEERDYYPYWHPTQWKDIHVLAERADRCEFYTKNSFNVKPKYECVEAWKTADSSKPPKHYSKFNNKIDCEAAGHQWLEFHNYLEILPHDENTCKQENATNLLNGKLIWGRPLFHVAKKCLVRLDPPKCEVAPYSRVNHLGNGLDLKALNIEWRIPAFPSKRTQKCVIRMRYNISTDDYDYTDTTNDQIVGDVFLMAGNRTKAMGYFTPLPRTRDDGKMHWATQDEAKYKAGEYIIYEKLKDHRNKPNQWIGFQSVFFRNRYVKYSFNIKFLGNVPPPSGNFGFKVLGVLYNDWVKTCKPDEWCYVEKLVNAKVDPKGNGDGNHVILIFDTIPTKRTIYIAELKVVVYEPAIENNPLVDVGNIGYGLRLAINTAQFGRTFQDRTHIFFLEHKDIFKTGETLNVVQVRGKRGNIVQTFPAVEYDFYPRDLVMREKDMLHITWTGSNSHNNGNPAGDGQAGDDGEGKRGSDRSNICTLNQRDANFPLHVDNPKNLCQNIREIVWSHYPVDTQDFKQAKLDICIQLMSGGYFRCFKDNGKCNGHSLFKKDAMNRDMDNAPASFPGIIVKLNAGVYHIVSTRNNNFSNRSQKGTITVTK